MVQTQLSNLNKVRSNKEKAKPFLKWAGGKSQLLEQLEKLYPQELKTGKVNKYFEVFSGGGAVFFSIIQKYPVQKAFLCDINQDLILAYRVIQQNVDELIALLKVIEADYFQSEPDKREQIFYKTRDRYNQQRVTFSYEAISNESVARVAWLIFLNKTCFNGLYRTNKKGEYNVPYGKYKKPTICNSSNLLKVSSCLEKVELKTGSYQLYKNNIDANSFVYLDPPYRPINKTSSFTAYAKSGFNDQNQIELSEYYHFLSVVTKAKLMLSNSNPHNTDVSDNFFHDLYADYHIHEVLANRMINSNGSNRGKISELVITNY